MTVDKIIVLPQWFRVRYALELSDLKDGIPDHRVGGAAWHGILPVEKEPTCHLQNICT